MNFDELTAMLETFRQDFNDSINWLSKPAESVEDELAMATIISVVNRFDEGMVAASEAIIAMAFMLTLCTPTTALNQFIAESLEDEETADTMRMILAMISTFVSDEKE